jgi:bifunctional DNase/RNase
MIRVRVEGVVVLAGQGLPVMLLHELTGRRRWLTVHIGVPEAEALVAAQQQVTHARPNTVELLLAVVGGFGRSVDRVELTALHDGIFHSDVVFDSGVRVSARPSDAVAVALLADAPVDVAESVLEEAGQEMEVAGAAPGDDNLVGRDEIEEFRSFLDAVTPDDFENHPPE